jgi:hypothetical protein
VRHPVPFDVGEEGADLRGAHHDDLAAEGQHREAEHPGRVGERRQREVPGPPVERVAHQREGCHRLDVGSGQLDALGAAGRPAGADDHREVVERRYVDGPGAEVEEIAPGERGVDRAVEADQRGEARQVVADLRDERREPLLEDQHRAAEEVEQFAVLGRLVTRVDRAPDGAGPADAEDAGERRRVVRRQDGDPVAGPHAPRGEGRRHAEAQLPHLGVRPGLPVGGEARRAGAE